MKTSFTYAILVLSLFGCGFDERFRDPSTDPGMNPDLSGEGMSDAAGSDLGDTDMGAPNTPTKNLAFAQIAPYPTAVPAYGVVVGDFKEDGYPDFAITSWKISGPNSVIVYLNKGNGAFAASSQPYSVGVEPQRLAAAVLTASKHLDLAIPCDDGANLLLGAGDGTFVHGSMVYPAGSVPNAIGVADFDGDTKIDLIVANFGDKSASLLPGNGNGTFGSAVPVSVGQYPISIAIADFNADTKPDFVVPNYGSSASATVLINAGKQMFYSPAPYKAGTSPAGVTVGDVNMDHQPDVIVSNTLGAGVLTNKGNGTFNDPNTYTAGPSPADVALADFNSDGKLDIAVANNGGGNASSVSVLLNDGNGTFPNHKEFPVGAGLRGVAVGDFNADGLPDIVVVGSDGVNVLFNTSTRGP